MKSKTDVFYKSESIKTLCGLFGLIVTLSGCGSSVKNSGTNESVRGQPAPVSTAPAVQSDTSGWIKKAYESPDRAFSISNEEMTDSEKDVQRKSYSQTDLVPVPVDTKYNVELFKIRNVPEYENIVFVKPRVYAYGGAQHGHVAPHKNNDGTISLSLPFALITGMQDSIPAADDSGPITIPEFLLVHKRDELLAYLNGRYGVPQIIASLPGCAKKITLRVNDQGYDVTPKGMADSNYCQVDKAMQAPLRVSEEDAKYIFQEALYAGSVHLDASFETLISFTTSRVSIHFSKAKLFQDLDAELKVEVPPYVDADVHTKLTKIVQSQAMQASIQGDLSGAVGQIVNQAVALFFEPYRPDPTHPLPKCGSAVVCLRVNYSHQDESGEFEAQWEQSTTALNGQILTSEAVMQPVQDETVQIGGGINRPALANDGTSIETGLTVVPGAQVEIKPSSIVYEQRVLDLPSVSTAHNNVCVAIAPTFGQQCHAHCTGMRGEGGGNCEDVCETVQTGTQCAKYEDHWVTATTFAKQEPLMSQMDQPAGTIQTLYEGLALEFTWGSQKNGDFKEVTCPLNIFQRVGKGESLTVTLENKPGCGVFSEDSKNNPMVSLVNNIQTPKRYKAGREVVRWDGKVLESPTESEYVPFVSFTGTVSVKGFDMMTVFSK